jgi:hypothetical protein
MKVVAYEEVGRSDVPQEIRDLRRSALDFHRRYGEPVIHKHRWTEEDERSGRAQRCPFHDDSYDQDRQWDPYCFGTGYLGGYDDGKILFVTIGDAAVDEFRLTEQGLLIHQDKPGLVAPWFPTLADEDLIIRATFSAQGWEVEDTHERYVLREVTPVTMRGFEPQVQRGRRGEFKVNQEAQIDKIPLGSNLYDVPIVFDYQNVPPAPEPGDYDPSDYPPGVGFASIDLPIVILGGEGMQTFSVERSIVLAVIGTESTAEREIMISGKAEGVFVHI